MALGQEAVMRAGRFVGRVGGLAGGVGCGCCGAGAPGWRGLMGLIPALRARRRMTLRTCSRAIECTSARHRSPSHRISPDTLDNPQNRHRVMVWESQLRAYVVIRMRVPLGLNRGSVDAPPALVSALPACLPVVVSSPPSGWCRRR